MPGSDLAQFRSSLDKVKVDVGVLHPHQIMILVDPNIDESEGDILFLNLMREPVKKKKGDKKDQPNFEQPNSEEPSSGSPSSEQQTTKGGYSFFRALVWEFYANYQATLEKMCKQGEKVVDQPLLERFLMRGVMVYLSERTINRFLHGPDCTPQDTSPILYSWLKDCEKQHPWLANLIAEGESKWLTNSNERIFKASLTQEARFWWGIVRIWLMPAAGYNILGDNRVVLVASLVAKLYLNFEEIISKEIKIRISRPDTAYPFPCLITKLCEVANVPEFVGVDQDIPSRKTYNPIRYDENQPRLK
ncbi:hypothetical protein CQW23_29042 [Capsicum baccatum]|uniref:Putative plant transposon protein domain-containing protein n=1 Tax=Capsicum baccatum TaxID=33114 RepID=A0A2G2VI94_CAPBA|nr:hypothetical protein CQW23_29042 [Capsicum baccatum]